MPYLDATHYVDVEMIFGSELAANPSAITTSESNVGVSAVRSTKATAYSDQYVISTSAPTPVIFDTRPIAGRRGDAITVYGHGLGSTEAEFSGQIQARKPDGTWEAQPVVAWARTAASANAYTASRVFDIESDPPNIDSEHETVQIVIPEWAVPINMSIRIVTDGP